MSPDIDSVSRRRPFGPVDQRHWTPPADAERRHVPNGKYAATGNTDRGMTNAIGTAIAGDLPTRDPRARTAAEHAADGEWTATPAPGAPRSRPPCRRPLGSGPAADPGRART